MLIFACFFAVAETFEYTPNFPDLYTSREVALADSYVADYSTYFSVWSNPANAGLTGNKMMLPFISLDMYSDFEKSIPLILSTLDSTEENVIDYLKKNDTAPLRMDITGPIFLGSIKNNFFWGIFNNTYANIDKVEIDSGFITGGEQTVFLAGYAYPIKLPLKSVISIGLSAKGYFDVQGLMENQPAKALVALKNFNFKEFPLYSTLGFGLDTGITISLFDVVVVSAAWNNFFAGAYTQKYDGLEQLKVFAKKYDTLATMPLEDNLILGATVKFPLDKITKGLISKFDGYVNCSDFLSFFEEEKPEDFNYMNFFTFGAEMELLSTISLRAGLSPDYLTFGAGLKMGVVKLDVGIYSKAWGLSKVDTKEIGFSFSLGTYK